MRFSPVIALGLAAAALSVGSLGGCVVTTTTDPDSSLLVMNESDFVIHEMYLTEINSPSWGPNLLAGDVMFPGDQLFVDVECGTYDALLIDETDAECEVANLTLCFDDADWIIRNNSCSVFQARAAEQAKAAKAASQSASTLAQ